MDEKKVITPDQTDKETTATPAIEEDAVESVKALQKEVAEKEQKVNQQLEVLWAGGTEQMLGGHPHDHTLVTPSPHQATPTKQQPMSSIKHEVPAIVTDHHEITPLPQEEDHEEKK